MVQQRARDPEAGIQDADADNEGKGNLGHWKITNYYDLFQNQSKIKNYMYYMFFINRSSQLIEVVYKQFMKKLIVCSFNTV